MNIEEFKSRLSEYATRKQPFMFLIDFERKQPFLSELEQAAQHGVYYNIKGNGNIAPKEIKRKIELINIPVDKHVYIEKFNKVKFELDNGNTYLLNLTFPSEIEINLTMEEIFHISLAPYKLLFKNKFVVFSPECFIKIENNEVFTYPMKGTIDSTINNAESILINNKKEAWEHNTIVDLMRNDLSMIAENITVQKYRYIERIKTHKNSILQTSSEIKGTLPVNWRETLGDIIMKLLPAGSISGAPKRKTVEIIKENELMPRGYYTGIFGIFNGTNLDSAVCIRFIEKRDDKLYFRSGGGITSNSVVDEEYNELIQKIYVPTF